MKECGSVVGQRKVVAETKKRIISNLFICQKRTLGIPLDKAEVGGRWIRSALDGGKLDGMNEGELESEGDRYEEH